MIPTGHHLKEEATTHNTTYHATHLITATFTAREVEGDIQVRRIKGGERVRERREDRGREIKYMY